MSYNVKTINLHDVNFGSPLQFHRAEVPSGFRSPLALIKYSLIGEDKERGMRLDLDKQIFLSHPFKSTQLENALLEVAPKIAEYLGKQLYN